MGVGRAGGRKGRAWVEVEGEVGGLRWEVLGGRF